MVFGLKEEKVLKRQIQTGPRIGVNFAGEYWAQKPTDFGFQKLNLVLNYDYAQINSPMVVLIVCRTNNFGMSPNREKNDYPVIYNAWNARYQYNPLTREMQPVLDNQTIGRAWSRDEFGRLNSMYFFSGVNGRDEDLLHTHKVKLDKNGSPMGR